MRSVQGYIARNLEAMLEARLLDTLDRDVLKNFALALRKRQQDKASWIRSVEPLDALMAKWADWLEEQDIPGPLTRSNAAQRASRTGASPKLAPVQPGPGRRRSSVSAQLQGAISPLTSPTVVPADYRAPGGDEIFEMDDEPVGSTAVVPRAAPTGSPSTPLVWKTASTQATPRFVARLWNTSLLIFCPDRTSEPSWPKLKARERALLLDRHRHRPQSGSRSRNYET